MRIVVALKQVPDLVEELEPSPEGTDVDREYITFVLNEFDDQALEEALLVKEATGAEVVVVALEDSDVDQTLYTALAKGADRAVKVTGAGASGGWLDTHSRAALLAAWLEGQDFDLLITGVQAPDDLDGQLPAIVAGRLGLPHASVVVSVEVKDGAARIRQEFSAGRSAVLEVPLPAVVGVQAARQAPRYAPISRIRQTMQAGGIEEVAVEAPPPASGFTIRRLYPPEKTSHAEMLTGSAGDVAARIVELLRAKGLVRA